MDLAQAMVTPAWTLAIAAGGAIGGALLASGGTSMLPTTVAALALLAFVMAPAGRRFAFPPGSRGQQSR